MATDSIEEVWHEWPRKTKLRYQISSEGRVRRWIKMTNSWRIITVKIRKAKKVGDRRRCFKSIHLARIIAEAFLPGFAGEGPYEADHIDGIRPLSRCR